MNIKPITYLAVLAMLSLSTAISAAALQKPTAQPELSYPNLLTGNYDQTITKPKEVLGFEVGQRTATVEQINRLVNLWAKQSDKAQIVEYARSYEDRALHYLVISAEQNINNLATIKDNIARLSQPDGVDKTKLNTLINNTPATAWMSYGIHGNESSGSDGALALIYHLIASQDDETLSLLNDLVILVDPMMNPDGRARFTTSLQEHRGAAANIDSQSMLHTGRWPFGRGNHYLYDLNRDFYFAVNPESSGRIKAINQWYPLLMVDGHEMGSQDSFLFGPPTEPINANIPASTNRWAKIFASDQAAAFDQQHWSYYTGEWFENLYPGYSNYVEYRGSIHILYEQASTDEDGVKTANNKIRTYKQSVAHQFVSSMANLKTLQKNQTAIFQDFVNNRQAMLSNKGPYGNRSYVLLPTNNSRRLAQFLAILDLQNINYFVTSKSQKVNRATDHLGQQLTNAVIPAGAIVIQNRQYEAPLIAAILEFDAKIKDSVLLEERQKTLRDGSSVMYDATAWNLTMMYGLPALEVPEHLTKNLSSYEKPTIVNEINESNDNAIAYAVNGDSDASVGFAARLMEQGIQVRVLDKPSVFNQQSLSRGAVLVSFDDNAMASTELLTVIKQAAQDTQSQLITITQGLGQGDLPDIGGRHVRLLARPKVAILSQNGMNVEDLGSIWHMIDTELGIRHSHLSHQLLNGMDLRKYNVIVVPSRYYGRLSATDIDTLQQWTNNGGTLIVNGNSAAQLAADKNFSQVKLLADSFEKSAEYNIALTREWLAQQNTISNQTLVDDHLLPADVWYPWQDDSKLKPMKKTDLEQWDSWTQRFMPSGAMVAARTDQQHWLTFGVDRQLPVLTANDPLFMVKQGANAVVRYGVHVKNAQTKARQIGWSTTPKGEDIYLRMSGLLWPEASQRIVNSAYLTQESKGKGQVIFFANKPNFRGASKGTARLLLNAIVYGPGLGATPPINF